MRASGFTLIELSIVLVIIALIIGGVTMGRAVKESADLQSIIADVNGYRNAAMIFKEKYKEIPGDFSSATSIWGTKAGCPTPTASNDFAVTTCNGTGNGYIGDPTVTDLNTDSSYYYENLLFWQHLVDAELIKGKFTGIRSTSLDNISMRINVPAAAIPNAGFGIHYITPSSELGGTGYKHAFVIGSYSGYGYQRMPAGPAFTGEQAKSMDTKIDDGNPNAGKFRAATNGGACTSATTVIGATYVADTTPKCAVLFITGF